MMIHLLRNLSTPPRKLHPLQIIAEPKNLRQLAVHNLPFG